MTADLALRLAYCANIAILAPVVTLLLTGPAHRVFGAATPDIASLKLLVAALWGAILLCSVAGLFRPQAMVAILLLQVIYKSAWLAGFVIPAMRAGEAVPWGPAITFVPIVLIWPFILAAAWR
ncbi:hypothetical protein [Erythrobacter dokdonensis]|uniref:Uncharacterized protein n=1 Tax=Erythrobacter dokdonensis DSW-74 TaxID=1300349 RepID=A0A1A7BER3_9SPHN|nr:hypothetical protein [Erythrobacter dokdonensis]OBV10974.1 hypothetical protein I603_1382 [Erythrobacter dokdonensis DSW-74]